MYLTKITKTFNYYLIIFLLIIILPARPLIKAQVFIKTQRKCAAATIYKRLDPYLIKYIICNKNHWILL